MVAPRTSNYRLTHDIVWSDDDHDRRFLEAGSFVRPIYHAYVPQHIVDDNPRFDPKTEIYVYTRYGITVVPKSYIEEA